MWNVHALVTDDEKIVCDLHGVEHRTSVTGDVAGLERGLGALSLEEWGFLESRSNAEVW